MGPRAFAHGDTSEERLTETVNYASMGPRAFAHGDNAYTVLAENAGSALQWGRGLSPTETRFAFWRGESFSFSFNGAAGFRPRRPILPRCVRRSSEMLQWGRGLSPTETGRPQRKRLLRKWRFNGAAGFRPRRR